MASNTPNLGLLKKDPATDGNDTFNIQTMMNDNWDKIDKSIGDHQNASMPHIFFDEDTGKKYRYGRRLSGGKPQLIYEEVL